MATLRAAADAEPAADARHNLYRGLVEQARTRLRAGEPPVGPAADLTEAADGWRLLAREYPRLPAYREFLAVGLTARGDARAAAGGGRIGRGLAAADYREAAAVVKGLLKAAPAAPSYWDAYGAAWAGLARLHAADDRRAAGRYYFQSHAAYRRAAEHGAENALTRADLAALVAEATAAGFDPAARP